MCGLAGRFSPDALAAAPGWARDASRLLAHRGPDGEGHFADERCELVHRRLALIDLSETGRQPMANEDGSVEVVLNGELYNFRELRQGLLARGHAFRGTSDTEVLVHLYEEEGERVAERLRGIFAFAIYDRPRRRLLLGRDRFGIKPLFFAEHQGAVVFASEMKAILAVPGFRGVLDRQACYDFLGLGYIPEPATGFTNIGALPHGHTLMISPAGRRLTRYFRAAAQPEARGLEASADALARGLVDAVGAQAVADVPVAALLSGGIDSSLVVAAYRRSTPGEAETFNVRFPDPDHDETPLARAVATQYDTRHHTVDVAAGSLSPDALMGLLTHFDQPFADTSLIPMYAVSKAVRERGIICALSGDGGDEAFGGYSRFWRMQRLATLMRAPASVRRMAVAAGRALTPATADIGRQMAKAAMLADESARDSSRMLAGLSSYLTEPQKAQLVAPDARERLLSGDRHFNHYEPAGVTDVEELSRRMTETLFQVSLPSDMLRKVDMMSMRASIEVRVPLLDEDVVGIGLGLPHALKTDGREGKLVMRALGRRWLPDEVSRHPKHGFSIPLDVMVPAGVHAAVRDLLCGSDARTRGVLDGREVAGFVDRFEAAGRTRGGGSVSREGLYQRVVMMLSLELWMREHRLTW